MRGSVDASKCIAQQCAGAVLPLQAMQIPSAKPSDTPDLQAILARSHMRKPYLQTLHSA